jgi:hypothetical protein
MATKTVTYVRGADDAVDRIVVMAYLGADEGDDDEIRVIRSVGDEVKSDEVDLHPGDGEQWLQQRHGEWTAAGYQVTTED